MEITRRRPETQRGPQEWFTGEVWLDAIGGAVVAPERFMTHIALQESDDDGNPAYWGEHVTQDEYLAGEG